MTTRDRIAITGMACRFPGGANSLAAFWHILVEGRNAVTEVPRSRFDIDRYFDRDGKPGKTPHRRGGFLDVDIESFDNSYFGLAPRVVRSLDPQFRILLELAAEAMDDAGEASHAIAGSRTGVFIGASDFDYWERVSAYPEELDLYSTFGRSHAFAAGHVARLFDLRGPAMAINTACASALSAVHLACASIRRGESDRALAGATGIMLEPHVLIGCRSVLSDACKAFDAGANGYVRSEGAGLMLLKPLEDAIAANDRIYAVIRGSAENCDGASTDSMFRPSASAQAAAIREAYRAADCSPGSVQYVECHGTGTAVGDPIEVGALGEVLADGRSLDRVCRLGSGKTNFGHLGPAAGMVGLIKTALALKLRVLPPSIHFREPNPAIPWAELPFEVQAELGPWPRAGEPLIAGVSAFGVHGSNVHVVLEEHRAPPAAAVVLARAELLPISARSEPALRALARAYRDRLGEGDEAVADIALTATTRRSHHEHRLAVVGDTRALWIEQLDRFLDDSAAPAHPGPIQDRRKLVFVYSGQGGQWLGMGRQLVRDEPVFRAELEQCADALRAHVDWNVLDVLCSDAHPERLERVDVIQPTLFALQTALTALWRSWGVEPDLVIGHSIGEVAAAHAAGALSLDDALRLCCLRSALFQRLTGQGSMLAVELTMQEAEALLTPYQGRVAVAVNNGPRATVVAGDTDALRVIEQELTARSVFCRWVKVDFAAHSPVVEAVVPELREGLRELDPRACRVPMISTVTGSDVAGESLDGSYWVRHMRSPVRFASALAVAADTEWPIFVEVSAHPLLVQPIRQALELAGRRGLALPSLKREQDERGSLLATLGQLYVHGQRLTGAHLAPLADRPPVDLPTYPWQRERSWVERRPRSAPAAAERSIVFEATLAPAADRYLVEHRIRGISVFPAAGYLAAGMAAAREAFPGRTAAFEDLELRSALTMNDHERRLRIEVVERRGDDIAVEVFSQRGADGERVVHGVGVLRAIGQAGVTGADRLDEARRRCTRPLSADDHYRQRRDTGLDYGESYRAVRALWIGDAESLAEIAPPDTLRADPRFAIHPCLLDACMQAMYWARPPGPLAMQVRVGRAMMLGTPPAGRPWYCHARWSRTTGLHDLTGFDADGAVIMRLEGLEVKPIESASAATAAPAPAAGLSYSIDWRDAPCTPAAAPPAGTWLILSDRGQVGDRLAGLVRSASCRAVRAIAGATAETTERDVYQVRSDHRDDLARVLDEIGPVQGIVHAFSLDAPSTNGLGVAGLDEAERLGCRSVLALIQALDGRERPPRLWLVTRGAQVVGRGRTAVSVAQAPLLGFARTLAGEHPGYRAVRIDLDPGGDPASDAELLRAELGVDFGEDEIAYRGGRRLCPRLVRAGADGATRLRTERPGELGSLVMAPAERTPPGPGEIEIEVGAAGLNFRDVLQALGALPLEDPSALGRECAGQVVAVGSGVDDLAIGDEVIAIGKPGSFASFVTVSAALAARKPPSLTTEQAAGVSLAFMTAHHALRTVARLRAGERILIHAGAGGVGLAAIQIAQRIGARVFATAGTPAKRDHLASLGVAKVMSSRTPEFADQVREATGGEGVDVVVNCLGGELLVKSLSVLAPEGRFVEIGKADILADLPIGLRLLDGNRSLHTVDLTALRQRHPDQYRALFVDVLRGFESGELSAPPVTSFPRDAAETAFRFMAQARHIGRVVIAMADRESTRPPAVLELRRDASYLVTGGLGALGLVIARWLVDRGARHLALMGRTPPGPTAVEAIAQLRGRGADVEVIQADAADQAQLSAALDAIARRLPPLRGVIHAAGVVDDGLLVQQTADRLAGVLAPKVKGSWNLHQLTRDLPLDLFVMFSSGAALLGSLGQGTYAGANAFLDTLAHHRASLGLPALSLNWGLWGETGLGVDSEVRRDNLRRSGALPMSNAEALAELEAWIERGACHGAVMARDWAQSFANVPTRRDRSLLKGFVGAPPAPPPRARAEVVSTPVASAAPARAAKAEVPAAAPAAPPDHSTSLRRLVCAVLELPESRVQPRDRLNRLGLDSLMALSLQHRIESEYDVTIPVAELLRGPTIEDLVSRLAGTPKPVSA